MACYYIVISSTHLRDGQLRSIKGVFRGPIGARGQRNTVRTPPRLFTNSETFFVCLGLKLKEKKKNPSASSRFVVARAFMKCKFVFVFFFCITQNSRKSLPVNQRNLNRPPPPLTLRATLLVDCQLFNHCVSTVN